METYTAVLKSKVELVNLFKKQKYATEDGMYIKPDNIEVLFDIAMFRFCAKRIEVMDDNTEFHYFDMKNTWGWCKDWLVENSIQEQN